MAAIWRIPSCRYYVSRKVKEYRKMIHTARKSVFTAALVPERGFCRCLLEKHDSVESGEIEAGKISSVPWLFAVSTD